MLQNYNTYKILRVFFDYPTKLFQKREISRITKLGLPSVINHLNTLEKQGFVKKEKKTIYESYTANRTEKFRRYRRNDLLLRVHESGLIEYLIDNTLPETIVLFGSASRGEDIETSDIDLFVLAKEKEIDFKKYELKLNRKINVFFSDNFKKLSKELKNNLINGIVLEGYLKVF